MGFSLEKAQKAVLKTQNKGVADALDVIMEPEEGEQPEKEAEPKEQKTKMIKAKWECAVCTLINTNGKTSCDACCMAAPEEAYEVIEEKLAEPKKQDS